MAKKLNPKAKAKREKVIAAVAGVVLLGVLAVAIPMTMKQLKPQNAVSAAAAPTPTGTTTTPSSTAAIALPTGSDALALGQLDSFSRFDSKDPFHQQIDPHAIAEAPGGAAGPTGTGSNGSGSSTVPGSAAPSGPPAAQPPPNAAVITVNGGPPQRITLGQDFPLPPFDPLFHLVAVTRKTARISIAGGSLSSGKATVTLRKGRTLTLMNTADGTQYELRLLWTGSGVPPTSILPPTPAAGSPAATTPAAATPPTGATVSTPATSTTTTTP